ncbi:hypothetical protein HOY80DRAFT_917279 [Tuber brumale]|nr:hypothetical protein HOY80DRAFT_917279 [Tuber brumale]
MPRDRRVRLEAMDRGCSQKFLPSFLLPFSPSDLIVPACPASESVLANHPANSSVHVPNLSTKICYQPHV